MKSRYLEQVSLLPNVIPEVAKESCFALHGGTAINLFVLDMPRLSVVFIHFEQPVGGLIRAVPEYLRDK